VLCCAVLCCEWALICVGEIRGQIGFPGYATTAFLARSQVTQPQLYNSSGVGTVVVTGPTTVNVSLTLVGIMNQTGAHLHMGGTVLALWAPAVVVWSVEKSAATSALANHSMHSSQVPSFAPSV
jgi:hypothetical protein